MIANTALVRTVALISVLVYIAEASFSDENQPYSAINIVPNTSTNGYTVEKDHEKDIHNTKTFEQAFEHHQKLLDKALTDILTLQHDNILLHSKLEKVMLQNVNLQKQCQQKCDVSDNFVRFQESLDTIESDVMLSSNDSNVHGKSPTQPKPVTQDTVAPNPDGHQHSNSGVSRRSKLIGTKRVAEVDASAAGRGFYARISHNLNEGGGHSLKYNDVVTNTHNDYNSYTGVFTCGTPGLYVFSWTIKADVHWVQSQLLKNGRAVAEGYTGDNREFWISSSTTAVLSLGKGDIVEVYILDSNAITILPTVTSFSGFLIK